MKAERVLALGGAAGPRASGKGDRWYQTLKYTGLIPRVSNQVKEVFDT